MSADVYHNNRRFRCKAFPMDLEENTQIILEILGLANPPASGRFYNYLIEIMEETSSYVFQKGIYT